LRSPWYEEAQDLSEQDENCEYGWDGRNDGQKAAFYSCIFGIPDIGDADVESDIPDEPGRR
jgi:hypothetical protein